MQTDLFVFEKQDKYIARKFANFAGHREYYSFIGEFIDMKN